MVPKAKALWADGKHYGEQLFSALHGATITSEILVGGELVDVKGCT